MTKRSKLLLVLACAMYALFSVLETLCVYFLAKIMECAERGDLQAMGRTVALTLGLWALTYLLTAAGTIVRLAFLSDSILSLRSDIIQSILRRPLQSFRGQNDGYYINLLSADVDLYSQDRLNLIPFAFACVSAVVSAAAMLFMLNRWLFLAGVALSLLPVATSNLFTNATRKRKTQMSQATESYMNVLREGIEGYEAIRMGGGQEPFTERFRAASARKQRAYSASAAANQISDAYGCAVLLKGGHNISDANDYLYADGVGTWFYGTHIDNPNTHGTGCTLSSAHIHPAVEGLSLWRPGSHAGFGEGTGSHAA